MNYDAYQAIKKELYAMKKLYDIEFAAYEEMTEKMEDFVLDNKLPEWFIKAIDARKAVIDSLLECMKEKNKERRKAYNAYLSEREAERQAEAEYTAAEEAREAEEDFEVLF